VPFLIVFRALAKETDGDFAKFVNQTNKPRDEAQRWRAFKNIARFFKHPAAYVYWKISPLHAQNRFRLIWALLIYHLYQTFMVYMLVKNKKQNMLEHWRWRMGETSNTNTMGNRDRRFPADRKKNYVRYSNFHQGLRNKRLGMIHLNWWCRDQNFRKYFEMRKKHDIRPSLSGFYHEKIYDEVAQKNAAIHAMRHSRQAK